MHGLSSVNTCTAIRQFNGYSRQEYALSTMTGLPCGSRAGMQQDMKAFVLCYCYI